MPIFEPWRYIHARIQELDYLYQSLHGMVMRQDTERPRLTIYCGSNQLVSLPASQHNIGQPILAHVVRRDMFRIANTLSLGITRATESNDCIGTRLTWEAHHGYLFPS